jgi:hypothetical protein
MAAHLARHQGSKRTAVRLGRRASCIRLSFWIPDVYSMVRQSRHHNGVSSTIDLRMICLRALLCCRECLLPRHFCNADLDIPARGVTFNRPNLGSKTRPLRPSRRGVRPPKWLLTMIMKVIGQMLLSRGVPSALVVARHQGKNKESGLSVGALRSR